MTFALEEPWEALTNDSDAARVLLRELSTEVAPGHPLHGRATTIIGRSHQADDVLVALDDGWAIVHLTWSRRPESRDHPATELLDDATSVQRALDIEAAEWRGD